MLALYRRYAAPEGLLESALRARCLFPVICRVAGRPKNTAAPKGAGGEKPEEIIAQTRALLGRVKGGF